MKPASSDEENIRLQGVDYLGLIGSILYAPTLTRPDGAFYANHCAKFMQKPKREHHEAALAVLAYLVKTHDLGITGWLLALTCPSCVCLLYTSPSPRDS